MDVQERLAGGLWGLLLASAMGEVREAWIREQPSSGSIRDRIPGASWGVEGAQVLCLLAALRQGDYSLDGLGERAIDWARLGVYFPDFWRYFHSLADPSKGPDLTGEPYSVLERYHKETLAQASLLFVIPLLIHGERSDASLIKKAFLLAHRGLKDDIDRATLAVVCLWAEAVFEGKPEAWVYATERLQAWSPALSLSPESVATVVRPDIGDYVHARTHPMLRVLGDVRQALKYTDTFDDTTDFAKPPYGAFRGSMTMTGAMAGLHYGISGLSPDFLPTLRGKHLVADLLGSEWVF